MLYLVALLLLPFKWLSPFSYAQAGWTDVLFAAVVLVWAIEAFTNGSRIRLRTPHYCYGAFAVLVAVSGLVTSEPRSTAIQNVLIAFELIAIAALTADYARSQSNRRLIARVILVVVLVTAAEAALGLLLFYLGHSTSLVTGYSSYFKSSHLYTRVQAGFYSPALLGNFTIFASAVIDMEGTGFSRRLRLLAQVLLALLVISTISRPALGFALALAIRLAARRGSPRAHLVGAAVGAVCVLAAVALTVVPLSADPFRPASSAAGINPRLSMIKTASTSFAHHPLVGKGPGSLVASWHGSALRAHLTPLNIAATTGVFSLVALVVLIVVLWRRRRKPTNLVLWSGAAGLALDALTQDVEHFRQVWLMLGMLDADRSLEADRSPPAHEPVSQPLCT